MRAAGVRVVAITDRTLMVSAAILTGGDPIAIAEAFGASIARALVGAAPGSTLVQVREHDADDRLLRALAHAAVAAARAAGQLVAINGRIELAIAAGADGVHLPERGVTVADARARVPPAMLVGASRHDRAGVLAAAAAELIHLGPIWPTPSKAGLVAALGPAALAIRRELRAGARLCAVGGIDSPARARAARDAGADAVAAIRAIWTAPDPAAAVVGLLL